jgi:hypothetical protein
MQGVRIQCAALIQGSLKSWGLLFKEEVPLGGEVH